MTVAAPRGRRLPRPGKRALAAVGLLLVAAGIVIAVVDPFGGGSPTPGAGDSTYPTSVATVRRESITSQSEQSATLGYADPSTVVEPAGTAPSALQQAQQGLTSAGSQVATARATLTSDSGALGQARASLTADRQKLSVDCAGAGAGETPAAGAGAGAGGGGASSPCAGDLQTVTTDQQNVSQTAAKVASDRQALASAQAGLSGARTSLAQAEASATAYGQSSTYTELPPLGSVVRRGGTLFEVGGQPVLLLFGGVAPWRAYAPGMSPGRDVAELNANLRALGYGSGLAGDAFTDATAAAVRALQSAHGLTATGTLLLGSVVFEPGPVRVTAVTPTLGATVQPGPVLSVTSTVREVTIELDAAEQSQVRVGDPVLITLPDNSTTPGRVSYVGTVATTPSSDQGGGPGGSSSPTIEVDVTPTDPAATGRLDQAPVTVSITQASVRNALVVPVSALLALSSGGYALEVIGTDGVHHLVAVQTGLFDDANGNVQVTGSGVAAGQRVVIPGE